MTRKFAIRPWVARLYPEHGSALYVRVQVWPTKRAMLDYLNAHHITVHGNRFGKRTEGACAGVDEHHVYDDGRRPRKSACFATINLWRGRLTVNVITHELFHATLRWAGRVGFDLSRIESFHCSMHEERITYVHGRLCQQFMLSARRPGGVLREAA